MAEETPVSAVEEGRTLCFFASDVHLGLEHQDPEGRERRFVSFLASLSRSRTHSLFLLGDIWDFWYEYKYVVPKGYVRVFAQILDLIDNGVKVYFCPGNHDVWAYSYFEELGMIKMQQPFTVTLGGKVFCLGHGDSLGSASLKDRFLHWMFHSKVLQALFSTLHPRLAFALGYGWSHSNRLSHDHHGEYKFEKGKVPLWNFALEYARSHKVDYFIFGHYHTFVDETLPTGERLLVLKDWMKGESYFFFDLRSGNLGISGSLPNSDQ